MASLLGRPLAEGTGASLIYSTAPKNRQGTVSWVQRAYTHTYTQIHIGRDAHIQFICTHIFKIYDDEIMYFGFKPRCNNRNTSCFCLMLMVLSLCPPLAMPQQVRTELSLVSGVEQARQLSVTPQTYSLCFSLVSHHPRGHFLPLILGIPFLLSWRKVLNSLVACPSLPYLFQ